MYKCLIDNTYNMKPFLKTVFQSITMALKNIYRLLVNLLTLASYSMCKMGGFFIFIYTKYI